MIAILVALLVALGPASALAGAPQERGRQTVDAVSAVLHDPQLQGLARERDRWRRDDSTGPDQPLTLPTRDPEEPPDSFPGIWGLRADYEDLSEAPPQTVQSDRDRDASE